MTSHWQRPALRRQALWYSRSRVCLRGRCSSRCDEDARGRSPIAAIASQGQELLKIFARWPANCQLCRAITPFILNDHPDLVQETGADGAHVGQDDASVAEARELAGEHAIIGKSTHSLAQALAAQREQPDYIGFGPLFATPTKPDYPPIGLNEITRTAPRFSTGLLHRRYQSRESIGSPCRRSSKSGHRFRHSPARIRKPIARIAEIFSTPRPLDPRLQKCL